MPSLVLPPGAFRLLLAIAVVVSHVSRLATGRLAVMLFFVLSGFWVMHLWQRERKSLGLFLLNRVLRIWPLYVLVVLSVACAMDRTIGLTSLTIIGVASAPGQKVLGVEWSLDIEVQFYLLLPLLAVRQVKWWMFAPVTLLGWVIVATSGIQNVFMYLPAFGAGMGLYAWRDRALPITAMQSLILFAALTAGLALSAPGWAMLDKSVPDSVNEDVFALIWGLPLLVYIAHSLRRPSAGIDRHLGNISYPLYLIHEPILTAAAPDGWVGKLALIVGICLLTIVVYLLVDNPLERARHHLLARLAARRALVRAIAVPGR